MIRLVTIVGARPQIIKAAALSREIRDSFSKQVSEVILHTGQHYDDAMSHVFFREMQIPEPSHNLGIGSASHGAQTGQMIQGIEDVLLYEKPDGVVVYGDTNSTLAGSLAAAKLHIPVIHIEAGLRSFNKRMPEEINRIACDHVSTLLFSPTQAGIVNLAKEGISHSPSEPFTIDRPGVFHSGDIMYDNTLYFRELAMEKSSVLRNLQLEEQPYILVTVHRPSNTDVPEHLKNILQALHGIARERSMQVILPLHPRTARVLEQGDPTKIYDIRNPSPLVNLIPAVSYLDMIRLESEARVILTDSGGVQKEAWFMEKPVVVLRDETEWIEIIDTGNGKIAGNTTEGILQATLEYLDSPPSDFPPIFGDGHAARQILEVLTSVGWR